MKKWSAIGLFLILNGCGGSGGDIGEIINNPPTLQRIEIIGMNNPSNDVSRTSIYSDAKIKRIFNNGQSEEYPLVYQHLFKNNDVIQSKIIGGIIDTFSQPIYDRSQNGIVTQFVADKFPAFALQLIDKQWVLLTGFSSSLKALPNHLNITTIDQNSGTGSLKVQQTPTFEGGYWKLGGGFFSDSHLLITEKDEPDAQSWENPDNRSNNELNSFLNLYYQDDTKISTSSAYRYGLIIDSKIQDNLTLFSSKHYSLGRIGRASIIVMPDKKTVYLGDSRQYGIFLMFIANAESDFSSGMLYAAKWEQLDKIKANLSWKYLGTTSDGEIKALVNNGITFSKIFETKDQSNAGFTTLQTSNGFEYLKLKEYQETAAAFLETRRYAAMLEATSEFSPITGFAINAKDKKLYAAMPIISQGMLDNSLDIQNHITMNKSNAGAIFEINLAAQQKDQRRENISSEWVATSIQISQTMTGEDLPTSDKIGNTATLEKPANPSVLAFHERLRTLFIGESGLSHVDRFVWAFQPDTQQLTKILYAPAEVATLQIIDNTNNFNYLLVSHAANTATNQSNIGYMLLTQN
jgi:hypothetical protein